MSIPGVTPRVRRDGSTSYEVQVRRPKVIVSPISRTFPTEAEAIEWREVTMAVAEQRRPRSAPPPVTTAAGLALAAWSAMYLVGSPGVRPGAHHLSPSARAYSMGRLRLHVLPVLGDRPLADIRAGDIGDLYAELHDGAVRPLAHASVARVHGLRSGVLRAAEVAELVATSPARHVRLPRRTEPPREIRAWSPSQVTAFLSHPTVQASPPHPLLLVASDTGVRRGELLGLTPADLHLDGPRPYLMVRRSLHQDRSTDAPKTDRSRRRLPLSPSAAAVLRVAEVTWAAGGSGPRSCGWTSRAGVVAEHGEQGVRAAGAGVRGVAGGPGGARGTDHVARHPALVRHQSPGRGGHRWRRSAS